MCWVNNRIISIYQPRDFEYRMCPYWVRIRASKIGSSTKYRYKTFTTYREAAEYAYYIQEGLTEALRLSLVTDLL
jgi:hypothetical protein